MFAARTLFVVALLGAAGTAAALAPHQRRGRGRLRPPWLLAVLTDELVPVRFGVEALLLAALVPFGALEHRIGRVGLALMLVTWLGYAVLLRRAAGTRQVVVEALDAAGIDPPAAPPTLTWRTVAGYPYRVPGGVERVEDLAYLPGLHLDLYRGDDGDHLRPAILQVHGGGWRGGNRRQQARPLLHTLAERGWVAVAPSYPLVPAAGVEEQVMALKRVVAWMRTEGPEHGIDPGFIAITGGSAGAHLASLIALTPNREAYQPGFEHVDTSLQAAVTMYGIYDLLNRHRTRDDWPVVRRLMGASPRDAEGRYREASPLDLVTADAPPFLVVHGASDSLVSPREARRFAQALRAESRQPVVCVELPGANHAFDLFYSLRTLHVIDGVARFLDAARTRSIG